MQENVHGRRNERTEEEGFKYVEQRKVAARDPEEEEGRPVGRQPHEDKECSDGLSPRELEDEPRKVTGEGKKIGWDGEFLHSGSSPRNYGGVINIKFDIYQNGYMGANLAEGLSVVNQFLRRRVCFYF